MKGMSTHATDLAPLSWRTLPTWAMFDLDGELMVRSSISKLEAHSKGLN